MKNEKAAIWVSTVLYTLIGLAIIGILLSVARPKINETKDKLVIEQTIDALNKLDETILRVEQTTGTRLEAIFKLSRGELEINGKEDKIVWRLKNSNYQLSEPNAVLKIGSIDILTKKNNDKWDISLTLDYKEKLDIKSSGKDEIKKLERAKLPYSLWIENLGVKEGLVEIDIST